MRRVFVRFLEEIEDSKMAFRNYLTFSRNDEKIYMKLLLSNSNAHCIMKEVPMILSKSVYNFAKSLQINLTYLFIISGTIL